MASSKRGAERHAAIGRLTTCSVGSVRSTATQNPSVERHARYVPVQDGRTLLGVVSFHDVAKAVYEEQSFENRMLRSYIKNSPDDEGQ